MADGECRNYESSQNLSAMERNINERGTAVVDGALSDGCWRDVTPLPLPRQGMSQQDVTPCASLFHKIFDCIEDVPLFSINRDDFDSPVCEMEISTTAPRKTIPLVSPVARVSPIFTPRTPPTPIPAAVHERQVSSFEDPVVPGLILRFEALREGVTGGAREGACLGSAIWRNSAADLTAFSSDVEDSLFPLDMVSTSSV